MRISLNDLFDAFDFCMSGGVLGCVDSVSSTGYHPAIVDENATHRNLKTGYSVKSYLPGIKT